MKSPGGSFSDIANRTDFDAARSTVSVYFADPVINHLFSELLKSRGVPTQISSSMAEASKNTRIITEPQFFPEVPAEKHATCLVVGNKESLHGLNTLVLSRPLTEDKIESALAKFLES